MKADTNTTRLRFAWKETTQKKTAKKETRTTCPLSNLVRAPSGSTRL